MTRHGDRTPINTMPQGVPMDWVEWNCEINEIEMYSLLTTSDQSFDQVYEYFLFSHLFFQNIFNFFKGKNIFLTGKLTQEIG